MFITGHARIIINLVFNFESIGYFPFFCKSEKNFEAFIRLGDLQERKLDISQYDNTKSIKGILFMIGGKNFEGKEKIIRKFNPVLILKMVIVIKRLTCKKFEKLDAFRIATDVLKTFGDESFLKLEATRRVDVAEGLN